MKNYSYFFILVLLNSLRSESLYEVYQNAEPGNGYDKYMVLDPNVVYTGGFGSSVYSVLLECNGAVIDLQSGTGIWMSGDESTSPSIVIKGCSIINGGYYGVNFSGYGSHEVFDCNFINDEWGIQAGEHTFTTIRNCNFIDNIYGLAIIGEDAEVNLAYCNGWGNTETYMSNCLG
ncbi:MAG: hypothetical protein CMG69_00885 [Candidatus Marinimicrobia bacterium]|nr:hypothetical protein [Candidatus Neomarinimicrobiota bacterium]|tara:strand:+ start:349 stop:873 length:525 start_codon:yes stop_codon:yes gene_type:complete